MVFWFVARLRTCHSICLFEHPWGTILLWREGCCEVFARVNLVQVVRCAARTKVTLMNARGIICNRLKVDSSVTNARAHRTSLIYSLEEHEPGTGDAGLERCPISRPERTRFSIRGCRDHLRLKCRWSELENDHRRRCLIYG